MFFCTSVSSQELCKEIIALNTTIFVLYCIFCIWRMCLLCPEKSSLLQHMVFMALFTSGHLLPVMALPPSIQPNSRGARCTTDGWEAAFLLHGTPEMGYRISQSQKGESRMRKEGIRAKHTEDQQNWTAVKAGRQERVGEKSKFLVRKKSN